MRRLSIVILIALITLAAPVALIADDSTHSCAKTEKSCCKEKADCCKTADAECCKAAKTCCSDEKCCTAAADGTHTCTMKHADGTACDAASCCKDKSCKKAS